MATTCCNRADTTLQSLDINRRWSGLCKAGAQLA
jgi:hypothetical protein